MAGTTAFSGATSIHANYAAVTQDFPLSEVINLHSAAGARFAEMRAWVSYIARIYMCGAQLAASNAACLTTPLANGDCNQSYVARPAKRERKRGGYIYWTSIERCFNLQAPAERHVRSDMRKPYQRRGRPAHRSGTNCLKLGRCAPS